jgi:hypothetical protein
VVAIYNNILHRGLRHAVAFALSDLQDLPQYLRLARDKQREVSGLSFLRSGGTESVVEEFFAKKILICPGGVPDAT